MKQWLWIWPWVVGSVAWSASSFPLRVQPVPASFRAGQGTVLHIQAPVQQALRAEVTDLSGARVATLDTSNAAAVYWDGRDAGGRPVHPGTYLIEIVDEPYLWNGAVEVTP